MTISGDEGRELCRGGASGVPFSGRGRSESDAAALSGVCGSRVKSCSDFLHRSRSFFFANFSSSSRFFRLASSSAFLASVCSFDSTSVASGWGDLPRLAAPFGKPAEGSSSPCSDTVIVGSGLSFLKFVLPVCSLPKIEGTVGA